MGKITEIEDQVLRFLGGGEERRASRRIPQDRPVTLYRPCPDGWGDPYPGRVYDVSADGICVVVDAPPRTGTRFATRSSKSADGYVTYVVVRSARGPGNRFIVGARRESGEPDPVPTNAVASRSGDTVPRMRWTGD